MRGRNHVIKEFEIGHKPRLALKEMLNKKIPLAALRVRMREERIRVV